MRSRYMMPFFILVSSGTFVRASLAEDKAADKEDKEEMIRIPAGRFIMGTEAGEADERPQRVITLPAFLMDRHEVTQAQYARCVQAEACPAAKPYAGSMGATLPAIGVDWHAARSFCAWRGKRLPSEAEWERAARGVDGRTYPWGAGLQCARANFGNFSGAGPCAKKNPGRVLPVGSRLAGASPDGVMDMAGNVWEWVADVYGPYAARTGPAGPVAEDSRNPAPRVVRGGSCCSYFAMPTTTNRLAFPPDYRDQDLGFRCARSPIP